jgi:predicted helicase
MGKHAIIVIKNKNNEYLQYYYARWKSNLFLNCKLDDNYNDEVERHKKDIGYQFTNDESRVKWAQNLLKDAMDGKHHKYVQNIRVGMYRPFCKQMIYFDRPFSWSHYLQQSFYPSMGTKNLLICVSGAGSSKGFSSLITDTIANYHTLDTGNCFPLYWYEENKNQQRTLFDEQTGEKYIRRDGITDWILKEVRSRYHASNITKEMIFYYVYGLLHSEDYRTRFAADLKKSLPRIPIVENLNDFMDFYQYGKKLADLHLNYENVDPYPGVVVRGDRKVTMETKRDPATGGFIEETTNPDDYEYFHIWDKMRFKSKDDKSTIIYNGNITIENIPQKAYEYIVNGKSAIEWIVERYCVSRDKKSLIMNDCNDWGKEHHKPRYILDLLLSVINVSVQTVDIVKALPKLKFD